MWYLAFIVQWYLKVLKQFADFDGRARRMEFWAFTLANIVVGSIFLALDHFAGTYDPDTPMGLFNTVYSIIVFIPSLAVSIRRFHDVGYSGWMILFGLIPIIGWIWFIVIAATEGHANPNYYGSNPKKNRNRHEQENESDISSMISNDRDKHKAYICSKCKKNVSYDDQFCWNCGHDFRPLKCPECNLEVSKIAKYCSSCGNELKALES